MPLADATDTAVGLARTLRAAGVDAGPGCVHQFVRSLAVLDAVDRSHVYWAGRVSLCASEDDIAQYDRVFASYFDGEDPHKRLRATAPPRTSALLPDDADPAAGSDADEGLSDEAPMMVIAEASARERLRHRDFAAMTAEERRIADQLLDRMRLPGELRVSRRTHRSRRGDLDRRRILRTVLRTGGEAGQLHRRHRQRRPRRVVLLVDVSGSMAPFASALLRFAHAAARRDATPTEVFTIGTRLTRVTDEMHHRDPDTAMAAVSRAVPDWSGGTRLGVLFKEFLDRWGQRGMARGAVVVVLSDGWERDDVALLGEQMERLARLAHRIVWSNPRRGRIGFEPTAAGMAAALPHVDELVSGHSLAALTELAEAVAGARQR